MTQRQSQWLKTIAITTTLVLFAMWFIDEDGPPPTILHSPSAAPQPQLPAPTATPQPAAVASTQASVAEVEEASNGHLELYVTRRSRRGDAPTLLLWGFDDPPTLQISKHVPWLPDRVVLPAEDIASCNHLLEGHPTFHHAGLAVDADGTMEDAIDLARCFGISARTEYAAHPSDTSAAAWVYALALKADPSVSSEDILKADALARELIHSPSREVQEVIADWSVLMLSYHGDTSRELVAQLQQSGVWTPSHEILLSLHELQRQIIEGNHEQAETEWTTRLRPQIQAICDTPPWPHLAYLACGLPSDFDSYFQDIDVDPLPEDPAKVRRSCVSRCLEPPPPACEGKEDVLVGVSRPADGGPWIQDSPPTCLAGRGLACIRACIPIDAYGSVTLQYFLERERWDDIGIWPDDALTDP